MDCPKCDQNFSIPVGPIEHGKQVRRTRHCVFCKAQWQTVEVTEAEYKRLKKEREGAMAARLQFTQMLEGK